MRFVMPSLVSRFHDAAESAEAWPDALKALTDAAGVAGAALIIFNKSTGNVDDVCFSGLSAAFKSDYLRHYAAVDPFSPLLDERWKKLSGCLPDQLLRKSDWYNDFVLACGVRDILGARIVDTSDHCVIIGIHQQIARSFSDRVDSTLGLVAVPLKDAARRYIEGFFSLKTGVFDDSRTGVSQGRRFYFHVESKSRYPDETGAVFSSADDARAQAVVIARELGHDENWHGSFVLVTDDRGQEIIRVRVGL
jgi:hypothetical protein